MEYAIVNKTVATMRSEADSKSSTVDEALFGMVVKLKRKEKNEWFYVKTHYNYEGYIHSKDLLFGDVKSLKWQKEAAYIVKHCIVDVMKKPDYKNYNIAVLTRGSYVKLTGEEHPDWAEIQLPNSETGWIRKNFVAERKTMDKTENECEIRNNLVNSALGYLGTQYRWGGKSPFGIDCSGLCSMAYMLNGILIFRDAELIVGEMKQINREEMKKGDLLYYKGHIAMYIGNDKVIHSSGSKSGVVINSLNPKGEDYDDYLDKDIIEIGSIF
ncbi:MAG: C40 family peptidase [Alkaliphilus sp.]